MEQHEHRNHPALKKTFSAHARVTLFALVVPTTARPTEVGLSAALNKPKDKPSLALATIQPTVYQILSNSLTEISLVIKPIYF